MTQGKVKVNGIQHAVEMACQALFLSFLDIPHINTSPATPENSVPDFFCQVVAQ